ncbi:MAG: hypothetical protein H0T89_08770 [Deltaproteobacteria bacterium]|nr:hypothetical protein [Deltaproteobacteria bacterium]MDQ3299995.1 hypothetical protein [Myxococcota bacterium]
MVSSSPSSGLRRLLETKLDTFEKLELVLRLRDCPAVTCSITELARQLQVGHEVLRRVITEVVRTGIVEQFAEDEVRLVADEDDLEAITEGAALFASDRTAAIALFSTIAMDRIRGMAARSFADAFTFRKKKDDGNG